MGSASLENYDPFSKDKQKVAAAPPSQPAVMSPTQEPAPPQYTPSAQQTVTNADFQRRQEELERKAAELARREEELKNSPYNARVNNWPPLPSFLPCQPCFYQDINVDIPVEFQEMVKRLYYLWLFHALLMIANLFGGICFLFSGQDKGSMFGLGLVYGFFFIPLSFLCWFRPAYKAFRNDSSFNFMLFFFIFFCQFVLLHNGPWYSWLRRCWHYHCNRHIHRQGGNRRHLFCRLPYSVHRCRLCRCRPCRLLHAYQDPRLLPRHWSFSVQSSSRVHLQRSEQ